MKKIIAVILIICWSFILCAAASDSQSAAEAKIAAEDFELTKIGGGELRFKVKFRNISETDLKKIHFDYQLLDQNGDILCSQSCGASNVAAGQAIWAGEYGVNNEHIDEAYSMCFVSSVYSPVGEDTPLREKAIFPLFHAEESNNSQESEGGFTLRNGIRFGDSKDTVRKEEVFSLDKTSSSTFAGKGNIAGYDNSTVVYHFDDSNRLTEIVYWFEDTKDQNLSRDRYETIYNGLAKKYGAPLDIAEGEFYPLTTSAFDYYNNTAAIVAFTGRIAELERYDEWLVPDGDGSVKIDLVSTCYGSADSLNYILHLAYKHFETDDGQTSQIRSDNDL